MPGGDLYGSDWDALRESVERVITRFEDDGSGLPLIFTEVGMGGGLTGRDMIAVIRERTSRPFEYHGIDIDESKIDDRIYFHHRGPSHRVYHLKHGDPIHWLFIDACHCAQCVTRDAILWGRLVVRGGEIAFHDAAPTMQGQDRQDYGGMGIYHNETVARDRGIDVRRVLDSGLLAGLELVRPSPDQHRGGVEVYRKK